MHRCEKQAVRSTEAKVSLARFFYLKSYLGKGNGAISFNLKERDNQQPQQQRYSAGHGYHSSVLTQVKRSLPDVLKVCDD